MREDEKLYQYKSFNKYTIMNILNNSIRVNSPRLFNDPYDCRILVEDEAFMKEFFVEIIKISKEELKSIKKNSPNEYSEALNKFKGNDELKKISEKRKRELFDYVDNNVYISCFTENNDSMLMWSHYADYHRGICIEYSKKTIKEKENFELKLMKVNYVNEHPKIDITSERLRDKLIENVATKNICWRYENEWRIIYLNRSSQAGFNIQVEKPTAIYMGSKISDNDRELLENICKEKRINLYRMRLNLDNYKLNQELVYKLI